MCNYEAIDLTMRIENRRVKSKDFNIHRRRCNKTRLKRMIQLQKFRFLILSWAIVLMLSISSIIIVKASESMNQPPMNKYYTSVTINSNDTLWDLADQFNCGFETKSQYINSIKKMNHMTSDTLFQGEHILVYYYSSEIK